MKSLYPGEIWNTVFWNVEDLPTEYIDMAEITMFTFVFGFQRVPMEMKQYLRNSKAGFKTHDYN